MSDSRNDDLDWLYRREPRDRPVSPEETRAMSDSELSELRARTERHDRESADRSRRTHAEPSRREPVRPVAPPPPEHDPDVPTRRPARGRHPVRRFFAVLGVLLVALLVWLVGVPVYAWTQGNDVEAFAADGRPDRQPGELYLLVGSDSREGLSEEERDELGTGDAEGRRADTMMLLYVPPEGQPALVSLPRDSYLEIPDNGSNKLNAAYAFGGPELLTATVEQNTGLRVDHYVEIGFGGFVNVIDAVGGIEMCVEEPIQDKASRLDLEAGCQEMDGATALGYVRMRKADPRGDLGRVERQREMLGALAAEAASPATVLNPFRYWSLNQAVAGALSTDPDTGLFDAGGMAMAMARVATGDGMTLTVPIGDPDYPTAAGSSVLWDSEDAPAMFDAMARGDSAALAQFTE